MYVDGKRVSAEILEKKKAREIYDDIVRRMRDPALLEYIDRGAFRMSIYPISARGEKRVQLEYSEVLKDEIISLSKKYGVITPYTSFLVLPEKEAEGLPLATRQFEMREALDQATAGVRMDRGQQAVAASKALKDMKSAPMIKEIYRVGDGAKGEIVVKFVGSKTFFFKNGFWTDS